MEQRLLGKTHLRASALGMGCSKLGAFWQGRSLSEGEHALHEAYEKGITYFDTADCYARGFSERLIGRAFRRCAPGAVVASKVGMLKTPAAVRLAHRFQGATGGLLAVARGMAPGRGSAAQCFHLAYVERAAPRSLRRPQRDSTATVAERLRTAVERPGVHCALVARRARRTSSRGSRR